MGSEKNVFGMHPFGKGCIPAGCTLMFKAAVALSLDLSRSNLVHLKRTISSFFGPTWVQLGPSGGPWGGVENGPKNLGLRKISKGLEQKCPAFKL